VSYLFSILERTERFREARVKSETLPVNSLLFTGNRVLALLDLYL